MLSGPIADASLAARTAGPARIVTGVVAVTVLQSIWLIACEALRERVPVALVVFLATAWPVLCAACLVALPRHRRTAPVLIITLLTLDVLIDLWVPYKPRFAIGRWEIARLAGVFVSARALGFVPQERSWLRATAAAIGAVSLALVLLVGITMGYIAITGARDSHARADVALVLGFGLDENGLPRPSMFARVEHGVELLRTGAVPLLVLSGGVMHPGQRAEAEVMHEIAIARGAPDAALVLEPRSHSSVENFTQSAPLLRALGARRVLIVTEPFHIPRAMLLARRSGLNAEPSPARSPAWQNPRESSYWVFRDAMFYVVERARDLWL